MTRTTPQDQLASRSIDHAISAVTDTLLRFPDLPDRSSRVSRWFFNLRAGLAFLYWAKECVRRDGAAALVGSGEILRLPLLALRALALQRQAALGDSASDDGEWREVRAAIALFEGVVGPVRRQGPAPTCVQAVPARIALAPAHG